MEHFETNEPRPDSSEYENYSPEATVELAQDIMFAPGGIVETLEGPDGKNILWCYGILDEEGPEVPAAVWDLTLFNEEGDWLLSYAGVDWPVALAYRYDQGTLFERSEDGSTWNVCDQVSIDDTVELLKKIQELKN